MFSKHRCHLAVELVPEPPSTFTEPGHVPSHTIGVTRAGQVVTTFADYAHEFFITSSEHDAMRLKGRNVVRSETTMSVLVIAASLGAMIAIQRGRETHGHGSTDRQSQQSHPSEPLRT